MNIMQIIAFLLLVLAAALIAGGMIAERRRREVLFLTKRSSPENDIPGVFGCIPDEVIEKSRQDCAGDTPEEAKEKIMEIIRNSDPDGEGSAVIYDESHDLVLVAASVMARIMQGDSDLAGRVEEFAEQFPTAGIMIVDFRIRPAGDAQ